MMKSLYHDGNTHQHRKDIHALSDHGTARIIPFLVYIYQAILLVKLYAQSTFVGHKRCFAVAEAVSVHVMHSNHQQTVATNPLHMHAKSPAATNPPSRACPESHDLGLTTDPCTHA